MHGGTFRLSLAWTLWLGAGGSAHAESSAVELAIEPGAPAWLAGCLSEGKLNESYRTAQAGGENGAPALSPLSVGVHAVAQKSAREATLEIRARHGARDLGARVLSVHAKDCGAMPDAVALVLVLLSRNAAAEPEPKPEPAPPPAEAAPTAPIDPELPPALAGPLPPAEPTPLRFRAGGSFSLVWGVLPQTGFGLAVEGELVSGAWGFRLRAQLLWPQTRRIAEGLVRLVPFGVGADACLGGPLETVPWLGLRACAGPRVSLIYASGSGFRLQNREPLEPALHLGTSFETSAQVAEFTWLRLHVDGAVALLRPRFVVNVQSEGAPNEVAVAGPQLLRGEVGLSVVQIF